MRRAALGIVWLCLGCQPEQVDLEVRLDVPSESRCAAPFPQRLASFLSAGDPTCSVASTSLLDANMVVVDLFTLASTAVRCQDCLTAAAACTRDRPPLHLCGAPPGEVSVANRVLEAVAFRDLDPNARYCIRVLAVERSEIGVDEPTGETPTACGEEVVRAYTERDRTSGNHLPAFCALSPPLQLSVAGGVVEIEDYACAASGLMRSACIGCGLIEGQSGCARIPELCDSRTASTVCEAGLDALLPFEACVALGEE